MEPPVQQGKEGAGAGVCQSRAARCREVARCGQRGEALIDGAGEMPLAEFHDVADLLGTRHGGNELAHVGDVGEELLDGSDAGRSVSVADEGGGHHFEKFFSVAKEEIVLVAVVTVERGAAHFCAIEHVLDGDRFEGLFVHEGDEGVAEVIARGSNAAVDFLFD